MPPAVRSEHQHQQEQGTTIVIPAFPFSQSASRSGPVSSTASHVAAMCQTTYAGAMTAWSALAELSDPGDSIRERRIELGWTQVELAGRSGIPQADISRIENGRLDARWSTIQRISSALANSNERPTRSLANGRRVTTTPTPPLKKWSAKGTTIAITRAKK